MSNPSNEKKPWWLAGWIWALALLGYLAVYAAFGVWAWVRTDHVIAGQIGDTFGALNALFSGVAMLGVVAAIFVQREELKLQRLELQEQREVLKLQREELARSAEASAMQAYTMAIGGYIQIQSKGHRTMSTADVNSAGQVLRRYMDHFEDSVPTRSE